MIIELLDLCGRFHSTRLARERPLWETHVIEGLADGPWTVVATMPAGLVDLGFVPIENAIEGSVNITLDALIFDHELRMQREVVIPIVMCLLAPAGVGMGDIERVLRDMEPTMFRDLRQGTDWLAQGKYPLCFLCRRIDRAALQAGHPGALKADYLP